MTGPVVPMSFLSGDAADADAAEIECAQRCTYCGKEGAAEAYKGGMFHGRCLNLVLLHHIPKHRFLARARRKA